MTLDRTLSIAPMMDCTDRHDRYLLRLISRRVLLYTEMVTANALTRGDPQRLLAFDAFERPLALQVGGSEPARMAACARLAEDYGFDEININCGCPSERVKSGAFGACLMAEPETVAACVGAMKAEVAIPVTVKTRIGIDELDSDAHLHAFTAALADAGIDALIVHARKAWLQGLSPRENREIPALDYARVARLKAAWPGLPVVLNGGLRTLDDVGEQLAHFDGCMLGRGPYGAPWSLARADPRLWGEPAAVASPHAVVRAYLAYVQARLAEGTPLNRMTRHLTGLFQGCRGARAWRRTLGEGAAAGGGPEVIERALECVPPEGETAPAPQQQALSVA